MGNVSFARKTCTPSSYLRDKQCAALWGAAFVGVRWAENAGLDVVARDAFDKQLATALAGFVDRWLICSQWAKRWAEASGPTVGKCVKELAGFAIRVKPLTHSAAVIAALQEQMTAWKTELEKNALAFVAEVRGTKREKVSAYYVPLWVWHGLDATRWTMSAIQLRENKQKQLSHEVDHIVAVGLWNEELGSVQPAPTAEEAAERGEIVNLLGNTFLLEKSFNISKGKQPLGHFLAAIHEFVNNVVDRNVWGAALSLHPEQIDSDQPTVARLRQLIEERTKIIKADLESFVRGTAVRADVT